MSTQYAVPSTQQGRRPGRRFVYSIWSHPGRPAAEQGNAFRHQRLIPVCCSLLLLLGLGLRSYHYLRDPSVWHDEAVLIVNVLDKSFIELLGPLAYAEAAPPLFLWLERVASLVLGDGTLALRLLPALASCASLLLVAALAWRWLPSGSVPWAILLFGCSNRLLWHGCEAKPYAVDAFAASAVLAIFCGTRSWPLRGQLLLYTLLAPLLIFVAYPGCFLCGGLLLALLPAVVRERRLGVWLSYAAFALVVAVAFGLLVLGPAHAQRCAAMDGCWEDHFPRWQRPWTVPGWMLFSSLDMVRYCLQPWGQLLTPVAIVGAVSWWRHGQRAWVVLLTVPIGLALAASCLHAYPYGGARVEVYATPALVLLIAAGLPAAFAWLRARWRWAPVALLVVLLAPLGLALYRVAMPWERADAEGASAFILAHRQPTDAIAGTQWEELYYFRHLGRASEEVHEMPPGSGKPVWLALWPGEDRETSTPALRERLWLVATGRTLEERLRSLEVLRLQNWRLLAQREFMHATVFLLGKDADTEVAER